MKFIKGFVVIVSLFFSSCSSKAPMMVDVTYKHYTNEIMSLDVFGYGSNKIEAIENAQMKAVDAILFRGIPNSNLNTPLVGTNEIEIRRNNKKYFERFENEKRYLSFITQSICNTPLHKLENGHKGVLAIIKINIVSLRRDLEENGIIRKFGY